MGGKEQGSQSDVLIPDTGASKYWYVDPRASTYKPDKHEELFGALQRLLGNSQYQEFQPTADQGNYQF